MSPGLKSNDNNLKTQNGTFYYKFILVTVVRPRDKRDSCHKLSLMRYITEKGRPSPFSDESTGQDLYFFKPDESHSLYKWEEVVLTRVRESVKTSQRV